MASGSDSTISASENRIPCFARLFLAFCGSQVTCIYVLYAYFHGGVNFPVSDGLTSGGSPAAAHAYSGGCRVQRVLATHLYDLSGLDLDQGLFYQRQ